MRFAMAKHTVKAKIVELSPDNSGPKIKIAPSLEYDKN